MSHPHSYRHALRWAGTIGLVLTCWIWIPLLHFCAAGAEIGNMVRSLHRKLWEE